MAWAFTQSLGKKLDGARCWELWRMWTVGSTLQMRCFVQGYLGSWPQLERGTLSSMVIAEGVEVKLLAIWFCGDRNMARSVGGQGPYAPQGSTSLLPKLSVTAKESARTSYAWVGSQVHFRSSEDVTLLEFTSPVDREYKRRRRKFHWI